MIYSGIHDSIQKKQRGQKPKRDTAVAAKPRKAEDFQAQLLNFSPFISCNLFDLFVLTLILISKLI